jgi:hypothetical protein
MLIHALESIKTDPEVPKLYPVIVISTLPAVTPNPGVIPSRDGESMAKIRELETREPTTT